VEVPTSGVIEARNKAGSAIAALPSPDGRERDKNTMKVKRIIGIFLVKQVGDFVAPADSIHILTITSSSSVFSSILAVSLVPQDPNR
jgi:hypothetical protein